MAGHSKWSKSILIKGPLDQKRGQLFSRLAAEITTAATLGGSDPSKNPRLRSAILAVRAQSMPDDKIERAIERVAGRGTEANLRLILTKNHDSFALPGAVCQIMHREGRVTVPAAAIQEGRLFDLVIEASDEELAQEDEEHVITTVSDQFYAGAEALENPDAPVDSQQPAFVSETQAAAVADPAVAAQVVKLLGVLEDSDGVQHVHARFAPVEEALAQFSI